MGNNRNKLLFYWMNKLQPACKKTYSTIFIRSCKTIFQITFDRASDFRQLSSYLVGSARMKFNFKQIIFFRSSFKSVSQTGFLRSLHLIIIYISFVLGLIFLKKVGDSGLIFGCPFFKNCQVYLFNLSVFDHFIEPRECFGCSRKKHYTTHRPVQPVNNTKEHFSWFFVFFSQVFFYFGIQRGITCFVTLSQIGRSFVNSYNMVVFV